MRFSRLILIVGLAFALATAGSVALVLHRSQTWTMRQIESEIDVEIGDLSAFYEQRRLLALKELVEERSSWRPSLGAVYLLAYKRSGERLGGNVLRLPVEARFDAPFSFRLVDEHGNDAGVTIRARAVVLNDAFNLLIGRSIEPRMALVRDFESSLPIMATAIGLLGLLALAAIGRAMRQRIEAINATARAVESGDLAVRAPGGETRDEFGDLARHFNRMLERLALLVATTRQTTDRIAHELRTPVTRLRARMEKAAQSADPQTRAAIGDAIEDTRKLSSIYDALLEISRIEARSGDRSGLAPVDLAEIVVEVGEFYEPAAEERGVGLQIEAPSSVVVAGDQVLLQRLCANLIDNALKFSPVGGRVEVICRAAGQTFELAVRDAGPGMPPEFMDRAFEAFSRSANASQIEGFGLGLAIVRAIVLRHEFAVSARNLDGGFEMQVTGACAVR